MVNISTAMMKILLVVGFILFFAISILGLKKFSEMAIGLMLPIS